jgi:predicted N-formylglutamate amidohydrolase
LLAQRLDCAFIRQRYSRLVIDCNRAPDAPSSIVEASDGSTILGNVGLDGEAKAARRAEIFAPYHAAISAAIAARIAARRPTILFSLHSFTPVWNASARPWRFGILHRNDSAFSHAILARLHAAWPEEVGDNEPYAMDGTDFTIPFHADAHRLDYVELEVRQDLISTEQGQSSVADALAPILVSALAG